MRIISVIDTSFSHRTKERSRQRTPMQITAVVFVAFALAFGVIAVAAGRPLPDVSAALAAAVADSSRPDSDTTRDGDRKPEQTLAFSGIKPGDLVADYVADAGYFTRLFASVVGAKGHVYAVEPTAFFKFEHFVKAVAELQGYAVTHPNVTVTTAAAAPTFTASPSSAPLTIPVTSRSMTPPLTWNASTPAATSSGATRAVS